MGNRAFFYKRVSVVDTDFPNTAQIILPFTANHLVIVSKSDNQTISFSFSKPELDGELDSSDGPIALDGVSVGKIWLKRAGDDPQTVKVWAWRL